MSSDAEHVTLQTQYGNILRMVPEGESPLLLPANKHKQLVVIDFEYANANLPGLEFANHFVSLSLPHYYVLFVGNLPSALTVTFRQSGHTTTMILTTHGVATPSTIQRLRSSIASYALIFCTHLRTEHLVLQRPIHLPHT